MNTLLMEAYEDLQKLRARRPEDPQDATLLGVMDTMWREMGEDEVTILKNRAFLRGKVQRPNA